MKKNQFIIGLFCLLLGALSITSCKKDEVNEFIADNSTFANFDTWTLESTLSGPDPSLGAAHAGNDNTVSRSIYFKDGQDPVDGVYPTGTVIVKHAGNPDASVAIYTAMVKRGNDFNPTNNDWEWFMLNADGTIAEDAEGNLLRGAALNNGGCGNCHGAASTSDYVFSK